MSALQTLIDGVALGAIYALVAIGLALVFGVMRLINFAHGELITAGGYTLALTGSWPLAALVYGALHGTSLDWIHALESGLVIPPLVVSLGLPLLRAHDDSRASARAPTAE